MTTDGGTDYEQKRVTTERNAALAASFLQLHGLHDIGAPEH